MPLYLCKECDDLAYRNLIAKIAKVKVTLMRQLDSCRNEEIKAGLRSALEQLEEL